MKKVHETLTTGVFYLQNNNCKIGYFEHEEYENFEEERIKKELFDQEIIDEAVKQASEHEFCDLQPLFIYAGNYYRYR